jgi:hypothetical protein
MSGLPKRTLTVVVIAIGVLAMSTAVVYAGTHGTHGPNAKSPKKHGSHHGHGRHGHQGFPPSVTRFDLSGYKLETRYTLGRNTGNTFQQTYTGSSVQGVPVEGPFVGTVFPPVDYVALPVAHKALYVAWLDPSTHAIVDAFVMNFKTGVVFDYAPGSAQPESSGTVRILTKGANRIP